MTATVGVLGAAPRYASLLRSQYWSPERLHDYVETRLEDTLAAALRIPFYRQRLAEGSRARDWPTLPVLPRAEVSSLEGSVRSLHSPGARLVTSRTSGSTGMPASFLFDASHQRGRFAARARYLLANGWSPIRRSAWVVQLRPDTPDEVFSRGRRFFGARFFSHVGDLEELAEALRKLDPAYLYAYPVTLDGLTRTFQSSVRPLPSLRRVFSGSEVLEDSLRSRIRELFGVDVSDNYGSSEAFLAWQCRAGSYHVNAEHVLLEIVDESGRPVGPGQMGRVLVTTLENFLMPLVRYEIGDYALAIEGGCACGRTLPRIGRVVGRGINLFVGAGGKPFVPWQLLRPLKDRAWVRQYQVVQRRIDHFLVRFAGDRPLPAEDQDGVRAHFAQSLGVLVTVEFERLDSIPRTPSGKFMTAICEV
jgi:phenylacetate-CoA ligase